MTKQEFLINMESCFGKEITIICTDNQTLTGILTGYTSELDNEPDGESIIIDDGPIPYEIFIDEIKSVEVK